MNEGLKKFEELLKTDTDFQKRLKTALKGYTRDKTEREMFEGVLVPFAKEYGISATFEEYKEYVHNIPNAERELSEDEVDLVAGGTKGFGGVLCSGAGFGLGGGSGDDGNVGCVFIGGGNGDIACVGTGL